jgi:magnesium-transporting ATPase (P-type)
MDRPPRPRNEPIFTRQLGLRCMLVGSVMALGAIAIFLDEYYGAIVMPHQPEPALRKAQTLVATTVVLFQIFYLLQCRSLRTSVFKMSPWSNPAIYYGIGLTLVLQLAFVHTPVMNALFHSAPIAFRDWLACAAVAASILPIMALEKSLFEKRIWRKAAEAAHRSSMPGRRR